MVNEHWANSYIEIPYINGGRCKKGFDCWGLVRWVLHKEMGGPLLESYGHVNADDKASLTKSFKSEVEHFIPFKAEEFSVAAGFRGPLLLHVGICIKVNNKLMVLEISKRHGVSITELKAFKRKYSKVEFYKYVSKIKSVPRQV